MLLDVLPETDGVPKKVASLMNGPVVNAEGRTDVVVNQGRSMICSIASVSEEGTMSDFSGMEDLLQDFLQEASDLLSDVDNKLVDLEKMPDDRGLLNDIFRGFIPSKGGAGFLNATELVTLCHLTENLFDRLRNGELELTPELMDIIMAATRGSRDVWRAGADGSAATGRSRVIADLQSAPGEAPLLSLPWNRRSRMALRRCLQQPRASASGAGLGGVARRRGRAACTSCASVPKHHKAEASAAGIAVTPAAGVPARPPSLPHLSRIGRRATTGRAVGR